MARYHERLGRDEVNKIFYQLCLAIAQLKDEKQAAVFLRDLISYQESEMIAKRLKIAEYLLEGLSYDDVKKKLKVSFGTIAKVQTWLKVSGEGYREAIKKTKGKDIKQEKEYQVVKDWYSLRKRFPMYYWPQILLENIVASADKREKEKIRSVLHQMDKMKQKSNLHKRLNKLISQSYQSYKTKH